MSRTAAGRPLHLRVTAIALSVMILTLAVVALLTYQLIQVGGRQEVDAMLRQELAQARTGLPAELAPGTGGTVTLDVAVQRFLAAHPGSDQHLTVVDVGDRRFSTREGPPTLTALRADTQLPPVQAGSLVTVETARGPVRILSAPVVHADPQIGRLGDVTVLGSLARNRAAANDALVRTAVAGAIGLTVGGVLLVFAVRRALRPVRLLVGAARAVGAADLEARVPEPPHAELGRLDEVGLLAHEFNRMLERISAEQHTRRGLVSAVSHELRTPLAVARGHLEMLERLGPSEADSARSTAAVVRHELDRLRRIVDDLTAIGDGDTGSSAVREPVFVPDLFATLQQRVDGLGLPDVTLEPAPPVLLLGDQDRLAQALLNLVVNARTHTAPSTSVTVAARVAGDTVELDVLDDGQGIDPEVLPHVFEPFVTTRPGGADRTSGLGLTVARTVTLAQGGTLELTSDAGGTRGVITLPTG